MTDSSRALAPEEMRSRWKQRPSLPMFPPAPADPGEWARYFDECFPEGVLMMRAHDEPTYPILDDSYLLLSQKVWVDSVDGDSAVVVVTDIYISRPIYLVGTREVLAIAPGVLVLGNSDGGCVRLDGHLTDDEKATVARVKTGGYFSQ